MSLSNLSQKSIYGCWLPYNENISFEAVHESSTLSFISEIYFLFWKVCIQRAKLLSIKYKFLRSSRRGAVKLVAMPWHTTVSTAPRSAPYERTYRMSTRVFKNLLNANNFFFFFIFAPAALFDTTNHYLRAFEGWSYTSTSRSEHTPGTVEHAVELFFLFCRLC
jgi:hypothetical protein